MSHHEKTGDNQVFVGNTKDGDAGIEWLHSQGVASARLGDVAYDIDGRRIPNDLGCRPVFIESEDRANYHRVMMKKTFGREGSGR